MATVTVKPRVVAGTDKGGEDLFLDFECTEKDGEFEVVFEDGAECSWEFEVDEDDEEKVVSARCTSGYYEFEWEGTPEDALALALAAGVDKDSNWEWFGSVSEEPKKRWCLEHFADGNAD